MVSTSLPQSPRKQSPAPATDNTIRCPGCRGGGSFMGGVIDCALCDRTGRVVSEYAQGYRVRLTGSPDVVFVVNPAGREYKVERKYHFCNCPATKECRHLRNIDLLMVEQANALATEANALQIQADNSRTYSLTAQGVIPSYGPFAADMRARAVALWDEAAKVRAAAWEGARRAAAATERE